MVEAPEPEARDPSAVFTALADPHRRQILAELRREQLIVGALVAALGLSQPGVTKYLGVLERAGLIHRRADGRRRICALRPQGFRAARGWLEDYRAFWEDALDRLATSAEEGPQDHGNDGHS